MRLDQIDELIAEYETKGGPGASYEVALASKQTYEDIYIKILSLDKQATVEDLGKGF